MAPNPMWKQQARARLKPPTKRRPGSSKIKAGKGYAAGAPASKPKTTTVVVNGQTIEVPAGQQYVPGKAGVLNPTIQPFMTGDDMMQKADEDFNLETGLYDLDTALEKMRVDTEYNKKQITKSEGEAKSATIDNMIARGLFRSSVKDGEIYDIQATATMRRNFMDTALSTATIETGVRKKALTDRADAIQKAIDRRMVDNADAANAGAPDYLEEPTAGHFAPAAPGAPKPPSTTKPRMTAYGRPMHYPAPRAPKPKAPRKPSSKAVIKPGKGYAAR